MALNNTTEKHWSSKSHAKLPFWLSFLFLFCENRAYSIVIKRTSE